MEHSFDVETAKKYGLEEAIVIKHLTFWIQKNKANGKHYYDGRTWTYNSMSAFAEIFSYLSYKQIRRVLESLKNQGVLCVGNYNENKYDQTLWYSLADEQMWLNSHLPKQEHSICPNGQMEAPKRANRSAQMGRPIPDTNTYTNTDNSSSESFFSVVKREIRRQQPSCMDSWATGQAKEIAMKYNKNDIKNVSALVSAWIENCYKKA